jgi:dynactin 1
MPYLADVRNSKSPFELVSVVSFVKLTVTSSIAKDIDPTTSPWEAVGQSLVQLIQETSKVLPLTMESEHVIKGVFRFPSFLHRLLRPLNCSNWCLSMDY